MKAWTSKVRLGFRHCVMQAVRGAHRVRRRLEPFRVSVGRDALVVLKLGGASVVVHSGVDRAGLRFCMCSHHSTTFQVRCRAHTIHHQRGIVRAKSQRDLVIKKKTHPQRKSRDVNHVLVHEGGKLHRAKQMLEILGCTYN